MPTNLTPDNERLKANAKLYKMAKHGDNRNIRVLQFLDAYQKQENLWNPALESYKNKSARDEAYMNIIHDLAVPSLTIDDVKLKVKSIRTTYTKELRLLIKHNKDGKLYNPKLFWFNRANAFLRNVSLSRDKRISVSFRPSVNEANDEYKSCIVDYISTPKRPRFEEPPDEASNAEVETGNSMASSYEYKKEFHNSTTLDSQIQDDLDQTESPSDEDVTSTKHITANMPEEFPVTVSTTDMISKFTDTCTTDPTIAAANTLVATCSGSFSRSSSNHVVEDDCDWFCRSVAAQLRSISDTYSRSVAKLKIQQILFEAETGHYRSNPCITIPVQQNTCNI